MRKIASLLAVLLLFNALAFAQTRTVSGKVTDEQGNPIPFASVTIKGTNQGAIADQAGSFNIKVKTGDVLLLTSQGFNVKEVTVGEGAAVNISLAKASDSLAEVIISSGYNTKKTQRSLTSNAQVVASEQLNTIRQSNLNNALAGKVAGVQLRSQSVAALGRDATVRLRGDGTLGGQGILYIVDGTPTNSVDINPDDIEDLTVLNGPTGAAIYGPQAADGAIVINTKRAKKNQKGIGVELNTGVQFDKIYIVPNYQNSYAGGGSEDLQKFTWTSAMPAEWQVLDGKYYRDQTDDASWGPRMVGQEYIPWYAWYPGHSRSFQTASLTPQPDNGRDFYNTGVTANNNINFTKAGDAYNLRVSYTNLDVKGLIPNSWLRRNTLAVNGSFDLGSHFTLGTNINYVTQNQQAENNDAYSNQSTGAFNQWFHRDLDMGILKELRGLTGPDGSLASWNKSNPPSGAPGVNFYKGNYWYNMYSYFDNVENLFRRDRTYGDLNLTYKLNNDIKIRGAYRKNFVTTWSENRTRYILESSATQTGVKAGYSTSETFFSDDRFELVGTFNKKISDFSIDVLAGSELVKIANKRMDAATRDGLYIPDFFAITNSLGPANYVTAGTGGQINPRSEEKRRAVFTRGSLGWKNMLFGEFTLRNDWYSTLPMIDNSIFVKSFGASFVFSDLVKEALPWLSYGKIRGSWGEVPQAIGPYNVALGYGVGADTWNGNFLMATPNQIVNPTIKGAVQATKEIGIDLRFLKSRAGISVTYYDAVTKNSPIAVSINGATGFTTQLINAGKITRKGLEFQLFGRPVVTKEISWDINATFSRILDNKVVELAPGINQIVLSSGAAFGGITTPVSVHQVGEQWGMIKGGGKKYLDGVPVLDPANGHYIKEENKFFGSVLPDYTGGIQNTFSYKNFQLNVNIDYQWGGKFFSLSDMWGSYSGLLARTATYNDKGNPIRDAVADGGGVHVVGVDENKNTVDMYVDAQDYFHGMINDNVYDEFIYDLTFVKLREVSLGYRFPLQKWGNVNKWIQSVTFSVVSRNPWLMYAKTKDFDPSEISNVYGENGQFPGTRSLGFNLKIGF